KSEACERPICPDRRKAWYNGDESRAFGKRFFDKTGAMPTYNHAAYYSATMTYLTRSRRSARPTPTR
ncbi:MAG: hypothetical protein WBA40_24180, partial [Roseiarcus sp.]